MNFNGEKMEALNEDFYLLEKDKDLFEFDDALTEEDQRLKYLESIIFKEKQ